MTLCAALTLLFVGLLLVSQTVGARIYQPPTLLTGLGACAAPCWNGIVLGESKVVDASAILNQRGFRAVGSANESDLIFRAGGRDCWIAVTFFNARVTTLRFSGCEVIRVGDVMLTLGAPGSIIATGGVGDWWRWRDNLIEAGVTGTASARTVIDTFSLDAPSGSVPSGTAWHGFIPFWRYCQLERVPYYCTGGAAINARP